jgi:DNA invertase Pin-like site-specific DNA recombinase
MARVAIYARVSTDGQTTSNQLVELNAWAAHAGHEVVKLYEDAGISGSKGRDKRPGFDAMLKGTVRREFDIVAVWSSDRLGRSLQHLIDVLQTIRMSGRELYIHTQALDTTTPSGRAMFQMLGVFAEFERAMIRERVMTGLARARAEGKQLGRRPVEQSNAKKVKTVLALRSRGLGIRRIAREAGLGVGTVLRLVSG